MRSPEPPPRSGPRSRGGAAFDLAAALACLGAAAVVAERLGGAPPPSWWPLLGVAAACGVALADLGSGLVHWFCDTWFEPSTPGIGPVLIAPFREHHADPTGIARRGALEVSSYNALLAAGMLLAAAPWAPRFGEDLAASLLLALWTASAVATAATNLIHRWAHHPRPPRAVAALQRAGLVLPPERHARHHRGGQRGAYCVTAGWCNPVLDRSGVLARLEARFAAEARARGTAGRGV
jgi:hypothetical protein